MLGGLIEANVESRPEKQKDFESLAAKVGIFVTDIDEGVTLDFRSGSLVVHNGLEPKRDITIRAEAGTVMSLSNLKIGLFGMPVYYDEVGRGVALKLLDGLAGNEVLGLQTADADSEKNEAESKDRAADDQRGPIRRHSAALQGGNTGFEQHDQGRHDQDSAADDKPHPGTYLRHFLGNLGTGELALLAHQRRHLIDQIDENLWNGTGMIHGGFSFIPSRRRPRAQPSS